MFQLLFSERSYEEVRQEEGAPRGEWPPADSDMAHFYNYAVQFYGA